MHTHKHTQTHNAIIAIFFTTEKCTHTHTHISKNIRLHLWLDIKQSRKKIYITSQKECNIHSVCKLVAKNYSSGSNVLVHVWYFVLCLIYLDDEEFFFLHSCSVQE